MLGFCPNPKENQVIKETAHEIAARFDLPEWESELLSTLEGFTKKVAGTTLPDLCCIDIVPKDSIRAAEMLRHRSNQVKILLIADPQIPPTAYIKPSIMATSLLLRPFSKKEVLETLVEMIRLLIKDEDGTFLLETRQISMRIPYEQISYFEARERKIWLCAQGRQYAFNDTLESLEKRLPKRFLRCHKGYIINSSHIQSVDYALNIISLQHGFEIPISRSCKHVVREICHV